MKNDFLIEDFGERKICLRGVGKMFYQDGFPIIMSIEKLKEQGIEVSLFHVADELLKNGWSPKTVVSRMREDLEKDITEIELFCNSSYEDQREMIFKYLFGSSTNEVRSGQNAEPIEWLKEKLNEKEKI